MNSIAEVSGERPATAFDPPTEEHRVEIAPCSWQRFEQLAALFPETKSLRLTYIDEVLEIMSPVGERHERHKRTLGYFVETYCQIKGLRYYGRGGFTLTEPEFAAGEPDESYCFGQDKAVPDLVIEVVISSDALSKLPLYQAKGIPEVWLWRKGHLLIHHLGAGGYVEATHSRLLPGLDAQLMDRCLAVADQYDAVRMFREALGREAT
jgi:Uma2 family endonuclease